MALQRMGSFSLGMPIISIGRLSIETMRAPLRVEERMVFGGQFGSFMSLMLLRCSFGKLVKMHSPTYPIC